MTIQILEEGTDRLSFDYMNMFTSPCYSFVDDQHESIFPVEVGQIEIPLFRLQRVFSQAVVAGLVMYSIVDDSGAL